MSPYAIAKQKNQIIQPVGDSLINVDTLQMRSAENVQSCSDQSVN